MAQILTYPHNTKYTSGTAYDTQVKEGLTGSIPCKKTITRGTRKNTAGGFEWWDGKGGTDSLTDAQNGYYAWEQAQRGRDQKGFEYWANTSNNGWADARWYDFGDMGGSNEGTTVSGSAKSSWLRDVSAVWFYFNGHGCTENRGCYSQIEKVAIRYRDPNGKLKFYIPTQQLASYKYGTGTRGASKVLFGYGLSSSHRSTVCNGQYNFLGLRIQIKLERSASGTHSDWIAGGVTGLRLGIGSGSPGNWNSTNKRVLVGYGDQTWTNYNSQTLFKLETR